MKAEVPETILAKGSPPLCARCAKGAPAKRLARKKGSRGAALIVVILSVAIMTTVVIDFVYNTRVELHMAANIRDEVRAFYLAKGGIDLARLALNMQGQIDMLASAMGANINVQIWQHVNQFMGVFNAGRIDLPMASVDLGEVQGLGKFKGAFDVRVDAEDGKINLNALANPGPQRDATIARLTYLMSPAQHRDLFESRGSDGSYSDIPDIISALIDWVDRDKDLTTMGADGQYAPTGPGQEDSRFSRLGSSLLPRNAPMDTIQEVMLVPGIDDDWWEAFGDSLTVYPSPAINVNTANSQLLAVLLCSHLTNPMDPLCDPFNPLRLIEVVTAIEMERRFRMMLFMTPFSRKESFVQFLQQGQGTIPFIQFEPLHPAGLDWQRMLSSITVESPRIFSLHGEGRIGTTIKRIHAVVDIQKRCQYLYWREF